MAAYIYRVTPPSDEECIVTWIQSNSKTGDPAFIKLTGGSIDLKAEAGTITACAGTTIQLVSSIPTTTTTTLAPTTTASPTTLAPQSWTLGYSLYSGTDACNDYSVSPTTAYSSNGSSLNNGLTLYSDSSLTTKVSNGYYSDGTYWYYVLNGLLSSKTYCVSPTTTSPTTISVSSHILGYHFTEQITACTSYTNYPTTFYMVSGESPDLGFILYKDSSLTVPADDAYYSDGTNVWTINTGTGEIAAEELCSSYTTTTTLAPTAAPTTASPTTTTLSPTAAPTAAPTTTLAPTAAPTTTTLAPEAVDLAYDVSDGGTACVNVATTYYMENGQTPANGRVLYTQPELGANLASDGYYSNGINYWRITGGDGTLFGETSCTTPTTTTLSPTTTTLSPTTTTLSPTTTTNEFTAYWSFTHAIGTSCTGATLEYSDDDGSSWTTLSTVTSGGDTGTLNLTVGMTYSFRTTTGNQNGTGCQYAYVSYDSNQIENSGTPSADYLNAIIIVTPTSADASFGVQICGSLGSGTTPCLTF